MPNVTFAIAAPSDIPLLQSLARTIWRAHFSGIISTAQIEYMLDRMYATETIENEMQAGTCWELIRQGTEAVGFLSYSYDETATRLKLRKLYVQVDRHGQGLGRASLGHVMQVAAILGAREVSLYVNKRNRKAIRAYERAGFTIAESVTNEFGAGFVMDDYRMTAPCARN
jgi:ribosomal protein S18 acetylase RimI-like enzyme